MGFFILIILAIIQAVTEFLPVSSSGHLVLAYRWFGIEDGTIFLSIVLHLATLLSIIVYYRKELLQLIIHPLCPTNRKLIVSTLVTGIVALIIRPIIKNSFSGDYIYFFFIITAILLFTSDYLSEKHYIMSRTKNFVSQSIKMNDSTKITHMSITYKQAISIGLTQGIACIPGISRSGSTIAVGKMCRVSDPTRYSFLLSIPIIIASFIMELFENRGTYFNFNISMVAAFVLCFVLGMLCIKLVSKISANNNLTYFAYYLIALSTFLIISAFFV
jgi:undecaprenyl-diphosphatase